MNTPADGIQLEDRVAHTLSCGFCGQPVPNGTEHSCEGKRNAEKQSEETK